MDYNKIKLGLIDRFRVWRERRAAERYREWYDKQEGEITEVDYSDADKLKAELLERKRIKKATRDAQRLFRHYNNKEKYGHDVWDGLGEEEFIEEYLVEHGVIQKALPEVEESIVEEPGKHSFMDKYPTEKSEEEIAYEQANVKIKFYYKIGDKEYELPEKFTQYVSNQQLFDRDIPLEDRGNGQYVVLPEQMKSFDKEKMLTYLIDTSIKDLAWEMEFNEVDEDVIENFEKMRRMTHAKKWLSNKQIVEGKEKEALDGLEKKLGEILQFRDDRIANEQEQEDVRE